MRTAKLALGVALISLAGLAACEPPAPPTESEQVYQDTCLSCHGGSRRGTALFDLTGLARANGGVFPMDRVIQTIDGRDGARAHGSPMPVWGEVYTPELVRDLAEYIASIQE